MGRPHLKTPAEIVVGSFSVTAPDGRSWNVKRFNTPRRGGCRYKVFSGEGHLLFDTNDCYDVGNATAKLDDWLQGQFSLHNVPW